MALQKSSSGPRRFGCPGFSRQPKPTRSLTISPAPKLRIHRYRTRSARTLSNSARPTKKQGYQRRIHSHLAPSRRLRARKPGRNPHRPRKTAGPNSLAGLTIKREAYGIQKTQTLRAHVILKNQTLQTTSVSALRPAPSLARHVARLSPPHRQPAYLFPRRPTMSRQI